METYLELRPSLDYAVQQFVRSWSSLRRAIDAWTTRDLHEYQAALHSAARAGIGALDYSLIVYLEHLCPEPEVVSDGLALRKAGFDHLITCMEEHAAPRLESDDVDRLRMARRLLEVASQQDMRSPPDRDLPEALLTIRRIMSAYLPVQEALPFLPELPVAWPDAAPVEGARSWARAYWGAHPWLRSVTAVGLLWACTLVFLGRSLLSDRIFWQGDTLNYYLPVLDVYRSALLRGSLPLWTPHIAAGYPLFADGEGGMLYPANLVLSWLLSTRDAYVWQMILRFWLASMFAFWFARVVGLSRLPSVVAATVFTFSSFMVGQLHHSNVGNSALWLPAVLACAELACRRTGLPRLTWSAAGGLAWAMAMLGLHVQPVLMMGFALGLWCAFRAISHVLDGLAGAASALGPPGTGGLDSHAATRRASLQRGLAMLLIPVGMALVAAGVAAPQLIPLYELSRQSGRTAGLAYQSATYFGATPFDLVTLLLPAFFRDATNAPWSLWFPWETTIYAGITPLVLATGAALFWRSRETWFFVALALVSLLLALGDYSPVKLYWLAWHLPGLSAFRAPGRFSYLFTFAAAMLAAYGMEWVIKSSPITEGALGLRPPASARRQLLKLAIGTAATMAVVAGVLLSAHLWVEQNPTRAVALVRDRYLALPHDYQFQVTPEVIAGDLQRSLATTTPRTALTLVFMGAAAASLAAGSHLITRQWCGYLLAGLTTVDLLIFSVGFHHFDSFARLTAASNAARFLADHPGMDRHYSRDVPPLGVEPDRLLALGRSDADSYTSLQIARVTAYLKRMKGSNGSLLNLMNVRYLITRKDPAAIQEYKGVRFVFDRPLVYSSSVNRGTTQVFTADGMRASELRLVGALVNDRHIPQGTEVGNVSVRDRTGGEYRFSLRAGEQIADEALELPTSVAVAHRPVEVAYRRRATLRASDSTVYDTLGYYAALPFGKDLAVDQVAVTFTHPDGQMKILGMSLVDAASAAAHPLTGLAQYRPGDPEFMKYRPVFEDATAYLDENTQALLRAFLVYQAVPAPGGGATLDAMAAPSFDPRERVLLEGPVPADLPGTAPALSEVRIDTYQDESVTISARTATPAILVVTDVYYPGWQAEVDGVEVPILAADYIFRGIYLSAGEHHVEFRYRPRSLLAGIAVAGATLAALGALAVTVWRRGWMRVVGGPLTST